MKKIALGQDTLPTLLRGVRFLEPLVGMLYGPAKQIVATSKGNKTKVATYSTGLLDDFSIPDEMGDVGVQLIRNVVNEVRNTAGSGAGIASVLAVAMIREGNKLITAGVPNIDVVRSLDKISKNFTKFLIDRAAEVKVKTEGQERVLYKGVATTVMGEDTLSDMLADMFVHVGEYGNVELRRGEAFKTKVEYTDGFSFKTSMYSYKFMPTSEKALDLENPYVLVTGRKLDSTQDMVGLLIHCNKNSRPLVIISEGIGKEVMELLLHNINRGALKAVAIRPPSYSTERFEALKDLALITGATLVPTEDISVKLTPECLGTVPRVVVTADKCSITYEATRMPATHLEHVQTLIDMEHRQIQKKQLKERLGNLKGKAAIVHVGGDSEIVRDANYFKLECAAHSIRGAMNEGMLPGGCQIFHDYAVQEKDPTICRTLVYAFRTPFLQVVMRMLNERPLHELVAKDSLEGYSYKDNCIAPMTVSGVVDSVKVLRIAAQCALSVARTVLSAGAIVREC